MSSRTATLLALLVGLGAPVRAGYLVAPVIFGLQARHFLAGECAVFQWGLAYVARLAALYEEAGVPLEGHR